MRRCACRARGISALPNGSTIPMVCTDWIRSVSYTHLKVFVDAPNSFLAHPGNNGNTAYGWCLWIMDRFNLRNHNVWEKMQTVPYASETWVNHYDNVTWTDPETGTQFQTDQWSHRCV